MADTIKQQEFSAAQEQPNSLPSTESARDDIVVERGRIPTPEEDALAEFAKELHKQSIETAVEFHKTMLGLTATFATLMSSAFAVVVLGIKDKQLDLFQKQTLAIPIVLMLLSSVCFALGYHPRKVHFQMKYLDTVRQARKKLIGTRRFYAILGTLLFVASILLLVSAFVFFNFK